MTAPTAPDKVAFRAWLPGFFALAAIWGSSFLFIKVGIREMHPVYVTLGRVGAGAITLLVVLAILRERLPRDPKLWLHSAVYAAIGIALPFTLFGYGEQRVSSMLAGIWNATTPLVVLPLAVLVFRTERMTARRGVGLGLGFVGVLVVLGVWQGLGGAHFTGQLLCFAAAACYGVAIPYQKRFFAGRPESGLALSAGQLLMATAQLAIVAPLIAGAPPVPTRLSGEVIASVLALGALGTGLAFVINMRNIRLAGASTASTVTYVIPIFAVLIGVLALNEHLAWYQPVGAAIVLVGVGVSQGMIGTRRRRREIPSGLAPVSESARV
ncbi:DMT family transporter [Plantactinospora soyae]|uniref:Drug/metabolite transporter (DMT)-like permease n=1 Tax=Plantactinospora soyae TaxID=1544732 RepID=A0A927M3R9_9ACTN|nr:DMT family transporter [Plantactinospora soyae]MBE1486372.1 drug/metabolite transporter (DMT)-like permease [Plantactinospora soyae]